MGASLSATTSFAAFLPPFGTPRAADFAVEVSPGENIKFEVVDERPGLVLGRGAPPLRGRTFHIDAGPYDTPSDAADALLRWISEYWECERVGDEQNSCFPYGGCHRRCWWRGSRGRVSLELELCAEAARLHEFHALRQRATFDQMGHGLLHIKIVHDQRPLDGFVVDDHVAQGVSYGGHR